MMTSTSHASHCPTWFYACSFLTFWGWENDDLARKVLNLEADIELSISVTTRPKRDSEKEGKDYHFVDESPFLKWSKEINF